MRYVPGFLFLGGCSGTKKIALIGNQIQAKSHSGREHLTEATSLFVAHESPLSAIQKADKDFQTIDSLVGEVHLAVTRVQDTMPWWVTPLLTVAVVVGVIVFLVYFGEPLKRLFMLLLPVPSRKKSAAKLISEGQVEQAVAILREGDPHFNRAYKSVNTARKLAPK